MLLTSSDTSVTRQITLIYCLSSCATFSVLGLVFYFSGTYILMGKSKAWPMFIPIVLFELIKWCLHHIIYEKDLKVKKANRFGNWSVVFRNIDVLEIIKGAFICLVGCVIFFIMAVLFGAQITSKHEETLMFSILLTFLTVFPMTLHSGRQAFMRFVADQPPPTMFHKLFYRTFQLTLIGAWIGAIFIPLDWDRAWQVWPITCSIGALLGNIVGYVFIFLQHFVLGSFNIFGKKKKSISSKYN